MMGPMEVRLAISHMIFLLMFCMPGIIHPGNIPDVRSHVGQLFLMSLSQP